MAVSCINLFLDESQQKDFGGVLLAECESGSLETELGHGLIIITGSVHIIQIDLRLLLESTKCTISGSNMTKKNPKHPSRCVVFC